MYTTTHGFFFTSSSQTTYPGAECRCVEVRPSLIEIFIVLDADYDIDDLVKKMGRLSLSMDRRSMSSPRRIKSDAYECRRSHIMRCKVKYAPQSQFPSAVLLRQNAISASLRYVLDPLRQVFPWSENALDGLPSAPQPPRSLHNSKSEVAPRFPSLIQSSSPPIISSQYSAIRLS